MSEPEVEQYGEPWYVLEAPAARVFPFALVSQDENFVRQHELMTLAMVLRGEGDRSLANRIASCVNALNGRDPAVLKELVEAARGMVDSSKASTDPTDWIAACDVLEAALDKFGKGQP